MLVDDAGRVSGAGDTERFRLDAAVADMYADLRVDPLLQRLLAHSRGLLGTVAGSISLVDPATGRYDKIAESGITCQLGRSFPLDEGATGEAVTRRMPVVIDDYSDVRSGHLPPGHPAGRGAAAAVPLWWRGEVIGVNVAFAGRARRFAAAEIDAFELLTQSVAAAVVKAGSAVPSLAGLLREHGRVVARDIGVQTVVTEVGSVRAVRGEVASDASAPHFVRGGRPAPDRIAPAPLTPREVQVLRLLADGLSDREVATRLGISPKTVEKHVGAVLRKTGTSSRTAAVMHGLDRGWLGPDLDTAGSGEREQGVSGHR